MEDEVYKTILEKLKQYDDTIDELSKKLKDFTEFNKALLSSKGYKDEDADPNKEAKAKLEKFIKE